MSYFLGIDLGTSYFKAGVFDERGTLLGMGRQSVEKDSAHGMTCELPVDRFRETLRTCVEEAVKESRILSRDISAVSYSSQANSFILLDKEDKPLTPLILWPDMRADEESEALLALVNHEGLLSITGSGIPPGRQYMIAKVEWFQKQQPGIWEKVNKIMSISDYLIFLLTGEFLTDTSTSSMAGLLDVRKSDWWTEAAGLFNINLNHLPTPVKTGAFVGKLTQRGAESIGLSTGASLFAGGLDHHMVAVGAGGANLKNISESTGTVLACVNYTKDYLPREGINVAQGVGGRCFFQMAFDENGAQALEWYQKNYASHYTIPGLLALAEGVEPGCGGLVALPQAYGFPGLEGFRERAGRHGDAHFIRAILESTAFSLLQLVKTLDRDQLSNVIIPSGGGAKSRLWLQIKANMLNRAFCVPDSVELACKGAAMLCAVGTSCFKDIEEATEKQMNFKERIEPDPREVDFYHVWCEKIKSNKI